MDKKIKIHFSTGVKYKGIYYLAAVHMNALFMYDENKNKLTFLTSFQKEKKSEYLYLKAFLYSNEAWFIPHKAEYIAIVNLDTYFIEYISLNYKKCYNYEGIKYINTLYFNKKYLCLIPWDLDTVLIADLQHKSIMAYYDIIEQQRDYQSAIFWDDKICFFPWKSNNILVLDLKTNKRIKLPYLEEKESFASVVYDNKTGSLFHAPAKQDYLLVDNLTSKVYRKIKFDCWNDKKYKTFYSTEGIDDIFFWGHERNIILKINKNDNSIKKYSIVSKYSQKNLFPICSDDIEALIYDENCIIKYNINEDKFSYLYISTSFDALIQEMENQGVDFIKKRKEKLLYENESWNLQYILFCTLNDARIKYNKIKKDIGNQIYNNI